MGNIKHILLMLLALLFLGSCVDFDMEPDTKIDAKSSIKLQLTSPSSNVIGMGTRSGDNSELSILRGYIFVFASNGAYKGYQKVTSDDVQANNSKYPTVTTTVSGYNSASDKLIAVFNYCEDSFVGESGFKNMTKETVSDYFPLDKAYLDKLQEDITSGKFALGMPMFVNDFDDVDSKTVHKVYRALSRIELYVEETDVSTSLESHVHSFNTTNVKYTLINEAENGEIGYDSRKDVAGKTGGSVYSSAEDITFDYTPKKYQPNQDVSNNEEVNSCIYLYEFPYSTKVITGDKLTQGVYDPDRLSILIEHEDQDAHPGETFYYKLQLVDKTTNKYYDIKRNHDYRVVIKNVYSDGYTNLDEAYLMPPSNIEYEIFDNQGDLTFSNGQYAISMDDVLNYESVTIYGPETTTLSFDNIRRILPSEVTDPLTDAEIQEMTNSVEFSYDCPGGVQVVVVQNDFDSDNKLTDQGKSIKLEISGEGVCTIKLKIKLGNLELGFDEITIHKIGSELGGDSSFDAHPCQLSIENQNMIPGTWSSKDIDFGARNDGTDMVIYMGENATPVGYKTLNGYITSNAVANAYPYFEAKTREGYFSYYDLESDPGKTKVKRAKIVLNQLPPFYVGHFGNKADGGPHYYNALIAEKIEEIKDDRYGRETGGLENWSENMGKIYYREGSIYGPYLGMYKYLNFTEGRDITESIVLNNTTSGELPIAARYCYMKNDVNGNGIIEDNEPIVWYLPAANQMLAMWISKHLIDSQIESKYFGFNIAEDPNAWYWTCSEVAPTDDDRNNGKFHSNAARFNMLEGEMHLTGRKGENGYDDLAHIRCVRNIVYDNNK